MKCLFIDGEAGVAGDMLLAALLDLGVSSERLTEVLQTVVPAPVNLKIEPVAIHGIAATRLTVNVAEGPSYRLLSDVISLLETGEISANIRIAAGRVFRRIAHAEAAVHSSTPEKVHFHEVGAHDAVCDVVGTLWALEQLGIKRVFTAPPVLGGGLGRSAHGPIPYPAPAVLEILKGKPVRAVPGIGETATPTGAALLAEIAEFIEVLCFTPSGTGYGAGHRDFKDRPNLIRATIGEIIPDWETDNLWLAVSDIDNTRPEVFEWLSHRLRHAGAVDVTMSSVGMKKQRQGVRVEVLCRAEDRGAVATVILSETASLGVRWMPVTRTKLPRSIETVASPWGAIRVKVARTPDGGRRGVPEYDDCRAAAEASGIPLITVWETVSRLFAGVNGGHDGSEGRNT